MPNYTTIHVLNIFLASPGDMDEERQVAREVVNSINRALQKAMGVHLNLLGWEEIAPRYGRPQEVINPDVQQCDLFIGILGTRWGQETGTFSSGFEEEFTLALTRRRSGNLPEIWLAFKKVEMGQLNDPGPQLSKVLAFRQRQKENREVLYKEFADVLEWRNLLHSWLLEHILNYLVENGQVIPLGSLSDSPRIGNESDLALISSRADEDKARQQTQISEVLQKSHSWSLGADSHPLNPFEVARLFLFAAALMSRQWTDSVLGTRELNALYFYRDKVKGVPLEREVIFRTMLQDYSDFVPGWYWFQDWDFRHITRVLASVATSDNDRLIRSHSIKLLGKAKVPLDQLQTVDGRSVTNALLDAEQGLQDDVLEYVGLVGNETHLEYVERITNAINFPFRDEALLCKCLILARIDSDRVLEQLEVAAPKMIEPLLEELSKNARRLDRNRLLSIALNQNLPQALRVFAFNTLAKSRQLKKDNINQLLKDSSTKIVELSVLYAHMRHYKFSVDSLLETRSSSLALPGEKPLSEKLGGLAPLLPYDYLMDQLDFYSSEGAAAYEVLAVYHFSQFSDRVRADLADGFSTLQEQASKRLREKLGTYADDLVRRYGELEGYLRDLHVTAALRGLNANGGENDIDFARQYIDSTNLTIQQLAVEIVSRLGDQRDVDALLIVVKTKIGEVQVTAAKAALQFAPNIIDIARSLIAEDAFTARAAINLFSYKDRKVVLPLMKPLLTDRDPRMRRLALIWLVRTHSSHELEVLLSDYLGESFYYFDVVCWLDRILYAPTTLRAIYKQSLISDENLF